MAARRVSLVFRFWHFHIHRASVLFDLAAEVAAEATAFMNKRLAFECFLQVHWRRTGRDSLPSVPLAQACKGTVNLTPCGSPLGYRTGGNDGRERQTFRCPSRYKRKGRSPDLEASENWDANSRVFRPFASPG